jgi:hypothetical protein
MGVDFSGSLNISGSMTATTIIVSAPGVAGMVSSSAQITELAPLMAYTSSLKGAIEVSGQNVNVLGMITAQQFNVTYVSSSVMYQSGSTKFGNSFDDKHEVTGSLNVSGGLLVNGTSAVTITSNTAGNNTLNLISTNNANSGKLQIGGATFGATIEKNSLATDSGLVFNSYHGGVEGYTFQSNGATKLKIGGSGRTEVTGSFNVNGEIRMDGSTLFRGMSSNTLQLCGGTSSSNIKINGASEEITMDTNGVTRVTIATAGTVTSTGNVAAPSFYRTLTTQAIPFTTWTTVFDMNSIAGIFLFSVQLDGQDAADWAASGIVMSTGATSGVTAQYIGTQNDGTYIQTRISGTTFQAYQNGTNPTVTMNVRVFKIG